MEDFMEISTKEHEAAVSRIYDAALDANLNNRPLSPGQKVVYAIEHMMQEVNSGASYEQYFRWASVEEIGAVCAVLRDLGLEEVACLTEQALEVAFPNGIPRSDEDKDELTNWNEGQETALAELFKQLEKYNGQVMNVLGAYVMRVGT